MLKVPGGLCLLLLETRWSQSLHVSKVLADSHMLRVRVQGGAGIVGSWHVLTFTDTCSVFLFRQDVKQYFSLFQLACL